MRRYLAAGILVLAATALPVGRGGTAAAQGPGMRRVESRPAGPETLPASLPASRPATQPDPLEAARQFYRKGDYAASANGYRGLLAKDDLRVSAAIGLAEALGAEGKYTEALEALKAVADKASGRADWRLAMADALTVLGRYEEALAHAIAANKLRPAWAPTILACGQLLETLGRKDDAKAVYKTMDQVIAADEYRKDARSLTAMGMILDRYSVLAGMKASEQARNILHNYLQAAYQEADEKYWPAHVAAGMFLLSKHNEREAAEEFTQALKLNGRIPDVYVGRGLIDLQAWRLEDCLRSADGALKINPRHADALALKAACLMQWRKLDQAAAPLEEVLKTNPNHLDALSLLAALYIRQGDPAKAQPYIDRVRKINARCAALPNTIGQWLSAARQYDQAEKHYRQAIELAPELAEPVTNLGLLYMQTGDEDKAREVLAKAAEIDDFRRDVHNYCRLLAKLKDYKVRETDHFLVKVDAGLDEVLLNLVADYAEQIYPEVCGDFAHQPSAKTMVEIFPSHADFSVRITGKGWIGTVGASTGRVVAMVAPDRERSGFGTYNWAAVLRHEFTHTVTLSGGANRIPHWFTEGCAVWEQPDRRNYDAVRLLVEAVRRGRLFPVKELDWGFIRPKRQADRTLAYAQSEWILEYIIATRKYETIGKMLQAFRDGMTQPEVFRKVLGAGEAEFDKAFAAWAAQEVEKWGYPATPPPDLVRSLAAVKANPQDAAAQGRLAVAFYHAGKMKEAQAAARAALKLNEKDTSALAVLATVLAAEKKYDEAAATARRLEELDHTSKTAPEILARVFMAQRKWADAIAQLELLKLRKPLDPYSYKELAKLYMQLGDGQRAMPNLVELHTRTMSEPEYARQIADICRSKLNAPEQALTYLRQVTYINPYEASAYEAETEICIQIGRYEDAARAAENLTLVQSDSARSWANLAAARYHLGRARGDVGVLRRAKAAAERALKIDPRDSRTERVLRMIEKAIGDGK